MDAQFAGCFQKYIWKTTFSQLNLKISYGFSVLQKIKHTFISSKAHISCILASHVSINFGMLRGRPAVAWYVSYEHLGFFTPNNAHLRFSNHLLKITCMPTSQVRLEEDVAAEIFC